VAAPDAKSSAASRSYIVCKTISHFTNFVEAFGTGEPHRILWIITVTKNTQERDRLARKRMKEVKQQ
jgi:hypothetical protein